MASRLELHEELCEILGSRNVYFQPPESKKIEYDCIIYNKEYINVKHADDQKYMLLDRYEIELIYKNPDNNISKVLLMHFKYCSFDRHFVSDNLYHDTFNLYY